MNIREMRDESNMDAKRVSIIDLNKMVENTMPARSTSQLENMVNLGGSFALIPAGDQDLDNQKHIQLS